MHLTIWDVIVVNGLGCLGFGLIVVARRDWQLLVGSLTMLLAAILFVLRYHPS